MRKAFRLILLCLTAFLIFSGNSNAYAQAKTYGESLCNREGFSCLTISAPRTQKLPTWETLWPDPREREIVMKLNRLNIRLRNGMKIALPDVMDGKTFMDYSPYPDFYEPPGEKLLIWDPGLLAWAAYAPDGTLMRWGPAVGGMSWCPDVGRPCRTVVGDFQIVKKAGPNYRSSKYPIGSCRGSVKGRPGCAPIPYFMQFEWSGYGFHGSPDVPGRNASHGCVRLFTEDARWLSENFVELETKVRVLPYPKSR